MRYLAGFLLSGALLNGIFRPAVLDTKNQYPPLFASRVQRSSLMDFWLLLAGSRRAAADYAWVRLLQYYGTHFEDRDETMETPRRELEAHGDEAGHEEHAHLYMGKYGDFTDKTYAVLKLDPFFRYAYLYSAGALAFNQGRYADSIGVLKYGMARIPRFWQLQMLLSAISYNKKTDYAGVIRALEAGAASPECPTLIKNILALIYERAGRISDAARLWQEIAVTSVEEGYRDRALKHLANLQNNHKI